MNYSNSDTNEVKARGLSPLLSIGCSEIMCTSPDLKLLYDIQA